MQLQATLESIEKNIPFFDTIKVIYKSDLAFKGGYEALEDIYGKDTFIEQGNFKEDVLNAFDGDYTLFLTDDDIVFRKTYSGCLEFDKDTVCFSLRLGKNISYCYSNNKPNTIKDYIESDVFIEWHWRNQQLDFAFLYRLQGMSLEQNLLRN